MANLEEIMTGDNDFDSETEQHNYRLLRRLLREGKREREGIYQVDNWESADLAHYVAKRLKGGVPLQTGPNGPNIFAWMLVAMLLAILAIDLISKL